MRNICFTVYSYDELADPIKPKAVESIRELINGPWWDQSDSDALTDTIMYGLAEALKTPGWDTFGVGDFPGVEGVTIISWDLERGQYLHTKGTLTRENAPALPWVDGMTSVALGDPDTGPLWVEWDDDHEDGVETNEVHAAEQTLKEAVTAAIEHAWKCGRDELDYLQSDARAKDYIEANNPEFYADGRFYSGS